MGQIQHSVAATLVSQDRCYKMHTDRGSSLKGLVSNLIDAEKYITNAAFLPIDM